MYYRISDIYFWITFSVPRWVKYINFTDILHWDQEAFNRNKANFATNWHMSLSVCVHEGKMVNPFVSSVITKCKSYRKWWVDFSQINHLLSFPHHFIQQPESHMYHRCFNHIWPVLSLQTSSDQFLLDYQLTILCSILITWPYSEILLRLSRWNPAVKPLKWPYGERSWNQGFVNKVNWWNPTHRFPFAVLWLMESI